MLLAFPLLGILEKLQASFVVLAHRRSLRNWGGDLTGYFPEGWFFGVDTGITAVIAFALIVAGLLIALRRAPRDIRWGLGAVVAFGVGAAMYLHTLDFVAPVAVAIAVVGLSHLRRPWMSVIALLFVLAGCATAAATRSRARSTSSRGRRSSSSGSTRCSVRGPRCDWT